MPLDGEAEESRLLRKRRMRVEEEGRDCLNTYSWAKQQVGSGSQAAAGRGVAVNAVQRHAARPSPSGQCERWKWSEATGTASHVIQSGGLTRWGKTDSLAKAAFLATAKCCICLLIHLCRQVMNEFFSLPFLWRRALQTSIAKHLFCTEYRVHELSAWLPFQPPSPPLPNHPRPLSGALNSAPAFSDKPGMAKAGDVVGKRSLANTGQAVEMLPSQRLGGWLRPGLLLAHPWANSGTA